MGYRELSRNTRLTLKITVLLFARTELLHRIQLVSWKGNTMGQVVITERFAAYMETVARTQKNVAEFFFWHNLRQTMCEHEYDTDSANSSNEDFLSVFHHCKKCGLGDFDESLIFVCDCSNCANLEVDGGDAVPYGSTVAHLPTYEICNAEELPEDDQACEDILSKIRHTPDCPYWRGKL